MTKTPFDLDTAIDAVAKQLTDVEHDPHLPARIAASLPDRPSWFGWWAPRLAMIAILAAAGIVWGNRGQEVTPGVSPLASSQPITRPLVLMAAVREAEPNRTPPLEPVEPLEQMEPALDFDRALPPIEALASIELDSLAPESLPEDAPLTVAPLAVTDLPLTPDSVSQQE
jgi:hypothetical protein